MKLKNITDEEIRFEGVVIAPHSESEDIELGIAQRMLAMWWHTKVVPVEEIIPAEDSDIADKEITGKDLPYSCETCGKSFRTLKGRDVHKTKLHSNGNS